MRRWFRQLDDPGSDLSKRSRPVPPCFVGPDCPACGAPEPTCLGRLADTVHFLCRACGMAFHKEVER